MRYELHIANSTTDISSHLSVSSDVSSDLSTYSVLALTQVTSNTTHGELETSLGRSSRGLLFSTATLSFSFAGHVDVVLVVVENGEVIRFCSMQKVVRRREAESWTIENQTDSKISFIIYSN